jgi:hypothetical protein
MNMEEQVAACATFGNSHCPVLPPPQAQQATFARLAAASSNEHR